MAIPVPRSFINELKFCVGTDCPPPGFTTKLEFIDVGSFKLFFDGRMAVLVLPPVVNEAGEITTEGRVEVLFFGNNFSNFSKTLFNILVDGKLIAYDCAEILLHQLKALYFKDYESAKKIIAATNPKDAKKYGREVLNFDADKWMQVSMQIMLEIARLKLDCPAVRGIFKLFTMSICAKLRIPPKNFRFSEATEFDSKFGTGVGINDMAQKIMASSAQTLLEESLYAGENMLGNSIQNAWMIYNQLVDDNSCQILTKNNKEEVEKFVKAHEDITIRTMLTKYEDVYKKPFYATTLINIEEDAVDDDIMIVEADDAVVDLKRSFTEAADDAPEEPLKRCLTEVAGRSMSEAPAGRSFSARTSSEL